MRELILLLSLFSGIGMSTKIVTSSTEWDFLIFTQQWPKIVCYEWMKQNPDHTCTLPISQNSWTIHGIWPTIKGTLGPFYCDKTREFNFTQLAPIVDELKQHWSNVEKETVLDSLWKHEWEKHGTCAAILDDLSDEPKYFKRGLDWLEQYSMNRILEQAGIQPGQSLYVSQIHDAVVKALNYSPVIHCVHSKQKQYLEEIRICFSKDLKLQDCDGALVNKEEPIYDGIITNCVLSQPLIYSASVPAPMEDDYYQTYPFGLSEFVNFYKLISFLRWFTF